MRYSSQRREAVLKKMMPPLNRSVAELAREEGISEPTLFAWRRQARESGRLLPNADAQPEGWASADKFAAMNETEPAEYCRKRALLVEQLKGWRIACEQANDWDRERSRELGATVRGERARTRELERELARKEKARAEAAALLVLRKKANAIWGTGEDE